VPTQEVVAGLPGCGWSGVICQVFSIAVNPEGADEVTWSLVWLCYHSQTPTKGSRSLFLVFALQRGHSLHPGSSSLHPTLTWNFLLGLFSTISLPKPFLLVKLLYPLLPNSAYVVTPLSMFKKFLPCFSLVHFLISLQDLTSSSPPTKSLSHQRCLRVPWVLFCGLLTSNHSSQLRLWITILLCLHLIFSTIFYFPWRNQLPVYPHECVALCFMCKRCSVNSVEWLKSWALFWIFLRFASWFSLWLIIPE
jgi:hypothetical protein